MYILRVYTPNNIFLSKLWACKGKGGFFEYWLHGFYSILNFEREYLS